MKFININFRRGSIALVHFHGHDTFGRAYLNVLEMICKATRVHRVSILSFFLIKKFIELFWYHNLKTGL